VFLVFPEAGYPVALLAVEMRESPVFMRAPKKPYRNSPSAFPRALSMRFVQFPQVFLGFYWFCSIFSTFWRF